MANPRLTAALSFTPPPKLAKSEKAAAESESCAEVIKLSFSLFPADTDRIDAICTTLAGKGRKISRSHAVRLALRAAELNDERLVELLDSMAGEDGRTRRHRK